MKNSSAIVTDKSKPQGREKISVGISDAVVVASAARLIDGVSLSASPGELVGVVGPNGAGKSTLLKAVSGLLRLEEGSISLHGNELRGLSPQQLSRILAVVPQLTPHSYGFTSMELVLMGRYPHMGRFQVEGSADRTAANEALDIVGLKEFAGRPVSTLSGGERQRVFIARALAQTPQILILDEPTASLDIQHRMKVLRMVRSLATDGVTTIAAIHDLELAARYCDRLVMLHQGRIVAEGTPFDVLTPANIEVAFGVRCAVYPDPLTGSLAISLMDLAPRHPRRATPMRIHLICGAGSGARLMYELREAGHHVTAGVLGSGDTDRTAADILNVLYVPVPAFGEINAEAHLRHLELIAATDVAILCNTPFGQNNLLNLRALVEAKRIVAWEETTFAARDYTGGEASQVYASLVPEALCSSIGEVLNALDRIGPSSGRPT